MTIHRSEQHWHLAHALCFVRQYDTILRETLGNLGCSPLVEKHMRILLAIVRFMAATTKT